MFFFNIENDLGWYLQWKNLCSYRSNAVICADLPVQVVFGRPLWDLNLYLLFTVFRNTSKGLWIELDLMFNEEPFMLSKLFKTSFQSYGVSPEWIVFRKTGHDQKNKPFTNATNPCLQMSSVFQRKELIRHLGTRVYSERNCNRVGIEVWLFMCYWYMRTIPQSFCSICIFTFRRDIPASISKLQHRSADSGKTCHKNLPQKPALFTWYHPSEIDPWPHGLGWGGVSVALQTGSFESRSPSASESHASCCGRFSGLETWMAGLTSITLSS